MQELAKIQLGMEEIETTKAQLILEQLALIKTFHTLFVRKRNTLDLSHVAFGCLLEIKIQHFFIANAKLDSHIIMSMKSLQVRNKSLKVMNY